MNIHSAATITRNIGLSRNRCYGLQALMRALPIYMYSTCYDVVLKISLGYIYFFLSVSILNG